MQVCSPPHLLTEVCCSSLLIFVEAFERGVGLNTRWPNGNESVVSHRSMRKSSFSLLAAL